MKKSFLIFAIALAIMTGCKTSQEITKYENNPELSNFLNETNLVFSQGKYWIKDIPETDKALGSLYKKVTKTIDSIQYTAFVHVTDFGFGEISDSSIIKGKLTYDKDYSFKRSTKADLAVLSMFSANYSNISEIKKKVVLSEVWAINPSNHEFENNYCDSSYYFVNRVYFGSSSDFGLQEVKGEAKFAGFDVGAGFEASQASNMHIIKEGVLTVMLESVISLDACCASDSLRIEITTKEVTPDLLEKELKLDGYKQK